MGALHCGDAVSLVLKSDPRYLCLVRAMVRSFGSLAGFDEAITHRITLAVDEGCTNIMRHAYEGRPDGDIEVSCCLELVPGGRRRLVVRLADAGRRMSRPDVTGRERGDPLTPGGLGIHLMRDIMDTVRFLVHEDGRNLLELALACPDDTSGASG